MSRKPGIWTVLGIEPTSDQDALRRAYLRKLRVTNPEDDAAAFQQLREAYEAAREMAAYELVESEDEQPESDAPAPLLEAVRAAPAPERHVDPETRAVQELLHELSRELRSQTPLNVERTEQLLDLLLSDSNLQRLDLVQWLDQCLADELGNAIPRSDHLLKVAAAALQWPERAAEPSLPSMAHAVLHRLTHVAYVDELETGKTDDAQAWRRLKGPEKPFDRWLLGHVTNHSSWPELDLLADLERSHPELLPQLNEWNVAWWQRFARRPRISGLLISGWLLMSLFAGLFASANANPASDRHSFIWWMMLFFGGLVVMGLVRVYLIEWPIIRAREHWGEEVPLWFGAGWVVDCLTLPLLGLVSRSVPWLAWTFAVFAMFTALWAAIAGGPTGSVFNKNGDGLNATNSRLLRIVFRNVFVGSWAAAVMHALYPALGLPLVITVTASLAASALGRDQQFQGFAEWRPIEKQWPLAWAALALTAAMMCAALTAGHLPEWQPAILVGTVCMVMLRRCFVPAITVAQGSANLIWIWVLLVVFMFVSAMVSGDTTALQESFASHWYISFGAFLLLATAMLSMVRFLWQHRASARGKITEA